MSKLRPPHPGWRKIVVALQEKAHMRQQDIGTKVGLAQSAIAELKSGIRKTVMFDPGLKLYMLYLERVLYKAFVVTKIARKKASAGR